MAEASGSGGLGALTLGGIAGVAVVVGGVVLYQLGVFGTVAPEGAVVSEETAGQAANSNSAFSGEGGESGQPLQNRAARDAGNEQAETADAGQQEDAAAPETTAGGEAAAEDQSQAVTAENKTEVTVEDTASGGTASVDQEAGEGTELAALEAPADAAAEPQPEAEAPKEDIFVLQAPELDLVRVDSDGAAVIAGRAQEGVQITVLLDGEVLEQLEVPAGGEFVSLTSIAPSADARVVSLLAEHDGEQSASGASFILAPVSPVAAAPAQKAEEIAEGAEDQVAALPAGEAQEAAQTQADASAPEPDAAGGAVQAADAVQGTQVEEITAAAEPAAEDPAPAAEPAAPQPQGQAVAVLRADQDGIEVVQPAVPSDPELSEEVALDSISYNGSGGVDLSGRARPQSRVRIYVDNRPVAELDAAQDGRWSGRLADVAPGVYTLRLDEIEPASGRVVSRLETPFKREAPELLPKPERDADPDQPVPLVRAVTVQKGDTLWAISQDKYGSGFLYVRVFEANRGAIRNPDLIYPGQVFTIPE
ncbi:LysM peptidoglycan-binding domain-containing protein [Leisingera sp. McT4-56]|uniref:LysM peptidoglycan-binding domain-containing protein n=1 Tax=Leisingera sp. McT4-56 TaxID=2881255 RepID=UPI001CF89E9F|nr:LysM peptidoglycan-binding domain-containing protein [Leisingera sp. McT4-56]MCB4455520.1 LysM peptidoglycan-binding domain-containing protein [Leisingera sp. McT4-56]